MTSLEFNIGTVLENSRGFYTVISRNGESITIEYEDGKKITTTVQQQKRNLEYLLLNNKYSYNREGFNRDGYDIKGFDRSGFNKLGWDRDGYDKQGFDKYGFNKVGVNIFNVKRSSFEKSLRTTQQMKKNISYFGVYYPTRFETPKNSKTTKTILEFKDTGECPKEWIEYILTYLFASSPVFVGTIIRDV